MKKKNLLCGILGACVITLSACAVPEASKATKESSAVDTKKDTIKITEAVTEPVTEKPTGNPNPVTKLGFYLPNKAKGVRELATGYTGPFTMGKDIVEYQVYPTDEPEISNGYFKDVWEGYWNQYQGTEGFKIGYTIDFKLTDGTVMHKTIRSPKDTESVFEYIEIYMYDDTHKTYGQWYSHVTEEEMTDEVLLTSIKLTAGKKIGNVGNLITVNAFVYKDSLDFDENDDYIGTCSKLMTYKRSE